VAHSLTLSARHPTHLPFYLYVKNVCKQQRKEQQHIANKSGKKTHRKVVGFDTAPLDRGGLGIADSGLDFCLSQQVNHRQLLPICLPKPPRRCGSRCSNGSSL